MTTDASASRLLRVENLSVSFPDDRNRLLKVVDDVSFSLAAGETLGIVGESGCGKSVTSLAIMGLISRRAGNVEGAITFQDQELTALAPAVLNDLRGNRLSMIFQEPMTSLNPSHTIGAQIVEAIRRHKTISAAEARTEALAMLRLVRIPAAERRFDDYPHKLSGGQRQRVMIAIALACNPELLIADEPTTALDVTIQAQILDLLQDLQSRNGTAIILITHDLGVVAQTARRVLVMYAGQIVEDAPVTALFKHPQHPYTVGLLGSIPSLEHPRERLAAIDGTVPRPGQVPAGCRFAPRCPFSDTRCRTETPALRAVEPGHLSRCWKTPLEALLS